MTQKNMVRMTRKQLFDLGYREGYAGRPYKKELGLISDDYETGWDCGNCDRPTLEELIPIDYDHEASDRCLS